MPMRPQRATPRGLPHAAQPVADNLRMPPQARLSPSFPTKRRHCFLLAAVVVKYKSHCTVNRSLHAGVRQTAGHPQI